jgi:hypothetical protein
MAAAKPVSKSYNQEQGERNRLPFEDSMKIIRKNNPSPNNSVLSQQGSVDASNNNRNNGRNPKKQADELSSESSESILSGADSDENNDPGTQMIRMEKLKKK